MYCMIKTCMEDKGISRLVNIWKTWNQGEGLKSGVFSSTGDRMTSSNTGWTTRYAPIPSQPEQTLPSKMGKPIVHLIAQKPCKCASFRRWETRSSSTDTWNSQINSSPSLGSLVLLFLSPWHSCDQGLHCRQEYALFPILILQRNYWVRKCLWIDAGAMTRSLMGWWPLGNWTLGPHVRFTQNRRLASFSESTTQGNFRFFSLICLKSSLVCGKRHIDHLVLLAIEFSFVISPVPTYSFFPRNSRPVWPLL